jgi:hypothetical protein
MPKKRVGVTLRKPSPAPESAAGAANTVLVGDTVLEVEAVPAPPEPKVMEAFVSGAVEAIEQAANAIPTARLRELLKGGIEGYRELVLYLPEKLAQQLSVHCLERNLDMNRLVASLVEEHLDGVGAARQRRAEDVGAETGSLRATARGLLVDLAHWVRSVLAKQRRPLSQSESPAAG